jgi:hypothetical protein
MLGAEMNQWIPSNGSDGQAFIDEWCSRCKRDARSDCKILAESFIGEVKEWVEHDDGRVECTAFVEIGSASPAPRMPFDDRTVDMFAERAPT